MSIADRKPIFDETLNPKYDGYDNAPYNPNNDHRGHLGTEDDIRMELWAKSILDKAKKFIIGEPPITEPDIVPAVYFDDVNEVLVYIDSENVRTTYVLGGDMQKSTYDTNDDGIVNSAHKEMVSFINKTGATLTKGTIVYLKSSSSSGTHPEALKANATTEAMSSKTVGAIYEDVANDATGYIVTSGEVDNLNTSAYTIGTKLWLSTTDGLVTTTAPTAPNHAVFIGTVTRSQTTNGRILYAIQNGYELGELHDVSSTAYATIQDGDSVLVKEVSSGLWRPSLWSNIKSVLKTYFDSLATTLTNKTISLGSNTVTMTAAQLNTAVTDNDVALINGGNTFSGNQTINGTVSAVGSYLFGGTAWRSIREETNGSGGNDLNFYNSSGGNPGGKISFKNSSGGLDYLNIGVDGSLTVNGQNRTSGWTSWTPTVTGSGGSIGGYTTQLGLYKQIGKQVHIMFRIRFTKGTLSGTVACPLPIPSTGQSDGQFVSGTICNDGTNPITQSLGMPSLYPNNISFTISAGSALTSFSSLGTGTIEIGCQFTYQTT